MRSAPVGLGKPPAVVSGDAQCSLGTTILAAHRKGGLDAVDPRELLLPSQALFDTTAGGLGHGDRQAARPGDGLPVLLIRELYLCTQRTQHNVSLLRALGAGQPRASRGRGTLRLRALAPRTAERAVPQLAPRRRPARTSSRRDRALNRHGNVITGLPLRDQATHLRLENPMVEARGSSVVS
jgi:hypothetical protein